VQGVMAVSPDGSHVYFVAKGTLTETLNADGAQPVEGGENLYVYSEGHVAFIATLTASDKQENWAQNVWNANVTPEGRFLVFTSHAGLTADADRAGGQGPAQVYRYDAQDGVLARVSIGLRGLDDNGNAGLGNATIVHAAEGISWQYAPGRVDPTMSSDGSRVFFESPVGLTPDALNDVPVSGSSGSSKLAENIYEWQAPGTGGCTEAAGCVSLLSDGRDTAEADGAAPSESAVALIGSDATGANVVFTTTDPLVSQDTDSQLDYYDARVDGGFPAAAAPPVVCASAEACRPGGSVPGVLGPAASATFTGSVNLAPQPPPKPVVLTRAQRLAKALRACRHEKSRKKRAVCERRARKAYGPVHAAKRPSGRGKKAARP